MAKIIKHSVTISNKKYDLEFGALDDAERPCFSFPCDAEGRLEPFRCREAEENYRRVVELSKTDSYYEPHVHEWEQKIVQPAIAECECGKQIKLTGQCLGASQCPACGRWHNMFGQELERPW